MNIGAPIQDTRGEPEFTPIPEVPGWLRVELRRNPAFVQEAIENADMAQIADSYLFSPDLYATISGALNIWIDHCWQATDYDAECLSRMWRENAEEAKEQKS